MGSSRLAALRPAAVVTAGTHSGTVTFAARALEFAPAWATQGVIRNLLDDRRDDIHAAVTVASVTRADDSTANIALTVGTTVHAWTANRGAGGTYWLANEAHENICVHGSVS